jgi:Spy/CpxP family protein refolding chaperone
VPAAADREAIEMSKTIRAILGGAAFALVLGAAAVGAQPPFPAEKGPRMGRPEGMTRFLALTEQQQEQVRKVMDERQAEHKALREKLERNRDQLQQALDSANPDPVAVGDLAIEGHRLRAQERALREAQDQAVRSLLTAEQQVKFDALKALREEGMGGPPAGGPPEGGPGWPRR